MKNYIKPEIEIINLANDADNMPLVSGNYVIVKFKKTKDYNVIEF